MTNILIFDYFMKKYSNKYHKVSMKEIQDMFKEVNVPVSINTLDDYLKVVKEFDAFIEENDFNKLELRGLETVRKAGSNYTKEVFKDNELRLFYDLIHGCHFLTLEDKQAMIQKLNYLSNERQQKKCGIDLLNHKDMRFIEPNSSLLTLENISKALSEKKNIRFNYYHYQYDYKNIFFKKQNIKIYYIQPVTTFHFDGYLYLVGINEEGAPRHYRIDRIGESMLVDRKVKYDVDVESIMNDVYMHLYAFGNYEHIEGVKLRISSQILDAFVDQFGNYITNIEHDPLTNDLYIQMENVPSGYGLTRWIVSLGKEVEVLYPEKLRNDVKEFVKEIYEKYED